MKLDQKIRTRSRRLNGRAGRAGSFLSSMTITTETAAALRIIAFSRREEESAGAPAGAGGEAIERPRARMSR